MAQTWQRTPSPDVADQPAAARSEAQPDWGNAANAEAVPPVAASEAPAAAKEAPWWAADPAATVGAATAPVDLDATLAELASRSSTIADALEQLRTANWRLALGVPGGGTSTDFADHTVRVDPEDTRDPDRLARTLAHELGHALDGAAAYDLDEPTRDAYVRTNTGIDLEGEAHATIEELETRDDVLATEGVDIGITGATAPEKIELWQSYHAQEISRDDLVDGLVTLFALREHPSTAPDSTYWYFYAEPHAAAWDEVHPTIAPLPVPGP